MVTLKRQTNARARVSRAVEWRNSSLKHHPRAPHLCVRGRPRGAQNSLIRKLPRDRLRWPCSLSVHVFGGGRTLESLLFRVFGAKTCLCHYGWRKLFWANWLSNCIFLVELPIDFIIVWKKVSKTVCSVEFKSAQQYPF